MFVRPRTYRVLSTIIYRKMRCRQTRVDDVPSGADIRHIQVFPLLFKGVDSEEDVLRAVDAELVED